MSDQRRQGAPTRGASPIRDTAERAERAVRDTAGSLFGIFSIDALHKEFQAEQQAVTSGEAAMNVTSKREQRLKQIEKKFINVMHMDIMVQPLYATQLPHHDVVMKIVRARRFQFFFFFLVAVYSLVMGLELQFDDEMYKDRWFRFNCGVAALFFGECALKLYGFGHHYFLVPWFVLEFGTTSAYIIALGMSYQGLDVSWQKTFVTLKVSRILLLGKLFSMRQEFQVIVLGFTRSIVSLWGVFFVILVVCYGGTLFCFSVVGRADYSNQPYFDHQAYFGSIPKTMMTLFSMLIVDEWAGYVRPVYEEQSAVAMFFVIFTVMITLGLLNVVTGMVVETVGKCAEEHADVVKTSQQNIQKKRLLKVINRIFKDTDGAPISEEEFKDHDNKEELMDMVDTVDFPTSFSLKDLFIMLDFPGQKSIMREQFVDGVMNFIHGDLFQLDCQIMLSINKVLRDIISVRKEMRVMHDCVQTDLQRDGEEGVSSKASLQGVSGRGGKPGLRRDDSHFGEFSVEGLANEFAAEQHEQRASTCLSLLPKTPKKKTGMDIMVEDEAGLERPDYLKGLPLQAQVDIWVNTKHFHAVYFTIAAMFSITMGFELEWNSESYERRFFALNCWFSFMFSLEAAMKLYTYGHNYFKVPWFCLEFATTWGGIFALGLDYTGMSEKYAKTFICLKLSRVLLLAKLFNLRKEFDIIVHSFTKSLLNLGGILFVLLVFNYGCTLFCYSVIGKHDYSAGDGTYLEIHELCWGSIPKTMITLFSMLVNDNWHAYALPVFEVQPPVVIFFFIYTVFLSLGLLNVVTGVVVETVNNVKINHEQKGQEKLRTAQKLKLARAVDLVFRNSTHVITENDFVSHSSRGELAELLEIVDFPHHFTLRDFFTILDNTGHKTLYKSQFVDSLVNLINSNVFHRECQILLAVHKLRRGVVDLRKEMATIHHRVRDIAALPLVPRVAPVEFHDPHAPPPPSEAFLHGQMRALSADARGKQTQDRGCHWEQLRTTLHDAAMEHCIEELRVAWVNLEHKYKSGAPDYKAHGFMPTPTPYPSTIADAQEAWYVWHKLYSAVSKESVHEMRQALEHARFTGVTEKSSAILFTFCDALARQEQIDGVNTTEVVQALEAGDWMRAIDLVVGISLTKGADKSLLLTAMSRFCADANSYPGSPRGQNGQSSRSPSNPTSSGGPGGNRLDLSGLDSAASNTISRVLQPAEQFEEGRGRLVEVLHKEASEHSERELSKAWESLDLAYKGADMAGQHKGAFGPGYSPFSKQEELFFIRNQINNGVNQANLLELRRALAHAMSFGIDLRNVELEVAYRDALARHHQGEGFKPEYVSQALERGDWWSALDDVLGASFARGADRHMLLKMIAKVCSPTVNFGSPRLAETGRSSERGRSDDRGRSGSRGGSRSDSRDFPMGRSVGFGTGMRDDTLAEI